ncbi:phosphatidylinositol 3- and 4-kinase domain-containing protein [Theileria equi strain WA]|uniref:Phosphatidylinositol 3-and 4-kinase domain-containing protein n=1 Tax=Theileria equi strain WA TaxID=1537102 RepID=L0B0F1_THEEQ|nr:phosphatidylinositol 3- and 4-kinase domain-containing protein [Theileria equi strain WA]AFZ81332.1 phosphatidylinositol 3- and 4-kinase domain-containing protein [Theileria equi strain WA]|eukprot:XP_004830998.1 phosphatidylinositol 3- and 4-kinase domain-containing protein [Theileria equi strain WA]
MVKRLLIKKLCLPSGTEVKDLRILYKGNELPNYRTMDSYINNSRSEYKLYWSVKETNPEFGIRPLGIKIPSKMQNIINDILLSMKHNIKPKLTMDGTGGTYQMFNKLRKCCAIFKPIDEEAFTPYNPRGYEGKMNQQGFRTGVLSGEGASREVAAYLLDEAYGGLCGVPITTMVEASHSAFKNSCDSKYTTDFEPGAKWKPGSLQEYIESRGTSGNYNPNLFSISDVHRIGILDLRVLNLDRNDENILVVNTTYSKQSSNSNRKYRLVPIDHGLILPDAIDIADIDLVWFTWPQSEVPFSQDELDLIYSFDPDKDAERLKKHLHIRSECLRTMKVTVRLLQIAASMHLNLKQIAQIVCRNDIDTPSELEITIKIAIERAYKITDSTSLMTTNRLGYNIDLIEHAGKVNQCKPAVFIDDDSSSSTSSSDNEDEIVSNTLPNVDELPSSTFFNYNNAEDLKYTNLVHTGRTKRATHRRRKPQQSEKSIWSLEDSRGHPIQFDWDAAFENTFFRLLEEMFIGGIQSSHPSWKKYQYNGETTEQFPWLNEDTHTFAFTHCWFKRD